MKTPAPAPAGEMLYGLKAISEFLGIRHRQALYLVEKGALPHWHEGRTICARPATLRQWMQEREAAGRPSAEPSR